MRRVVVLAGESLAVETPQGTIAIFVTSTGRITTGEITVYEGVLGGPKSFHLDHPVPLSRIAADWVATWKSARQPIQLYYLLDKDKE